MKSILSGSLLVAGTTIGGGMLAIPLVTAKVGFIPSFLLMLLVWFVMYLSALFVVQSIVWMDHKVNFLHIAQFYLGQKGKWITGSLFIFLYGCLLVAYFSGLGPLVHSIWKSLFTASLSPFGITIALALFFGLIVAFGMKQIDRTNAILFAGLLVTFCVLVLLTLGHVKVELLTAHHPLFFFSPLPLLFTSFGYHNILPSMTYYLEKDSKKISRAILYGSLITLGVYTIWQVVMLGVIDQQTLAQFTAQNIPPTLALEIVLHNTWIHKIALLFSFFAITTSLLGVAFSLVDFVLDGLNWHTKGKPRWVVTAFVFVLPVLFAIVDPHIFVRALTVAGAYGESILNGILPCFFFYSGHKWMNKKWTLPLGRWRWYIFLIGLVSVAAVVFSIIG